VRNTEIVGLCMVICAGLMNGSFAVPMKLARQWTWENMWLGWSFIGLLLMPLVLTLVTVPNLSAVYRETNSGILLLVLAFGTAWGFGQVLFGLGIKQIGIAIGFAIVVGVAAASGSLLPLLIISPSSLSSRSGSAALCGVAMVLCGVALCSYAGRKREAANPDVPANPVASGRAWMGTFICVAAGIGGSMINLGLIFGDPISMAANRAGAAAIFQQNAIWLPLLFAGFCATFSYCAVQLTRNRTWARFLLPGATREWALALAMAALWFGSVEVYGRFSSSLGPLGPVLGWPIFLSCSIVSANVWGFLFGEWDKAPRRPRLVMGCGIAVLIAAVFILGYSAH
jgi:L-rhamnose-H+ transport protein